MTNRDYILKTCPYDLLIELKDAINFNHEYLCLMEHLRDEYIYGVDEDNKNRCRLSTQREYIDCDKCIQKWLNEERR